MTDPTEVEARGDWLHVVGERAARVVAAIQNIDAYDAQLRATEREKVRALVNRLVSKARCGCGLVSIDYGEAVPHTEDCPWVAARLWLDGGAE